MTLREALRMMADHPVQLFVRQWNWKAAALSALLRALVFYFTNRSAGSRAAWTAVGVEFAYRIGTSGFFGSLIQTLSRVQPKRVSMAAVIIVLPAANQGLDALVHWWQGTPRLGASLFVASLITVWASLFNWYAMREGTFVVGHGQRSFGEDMRGLPVLLWRFTFGWMGRRR